MNISIKMLVLAYAFTALCHKSHTSIYNHINNCLCFYI